MIDLHTHILPGVDDGARDDAEALAMLAAAANDGITTVVATPHAHHAGAERVLDGVDRLNAAARDAGTDITILPGHEARISAELATRHRDGALLTLNGTRWLLLECVLFDDWPLHLIERSVDRLLAAGLRPVLAHAERYTFVQRHPDVLASLIGRGIPIQVNAGSLFLRPDDIERVTAETLLRTRTAHVIASDAHNARYRPPALRAAYERAAEIAGEEYAGWMRAVPQRVIAGDEVILPE
ncbi:MAG TPA: CpsB/CapC family capsule biosynthesis tyrosine phosphatase [Thermomicrobiales bacterium]|nr:CpsB/CapC family capsule biosynthesis tyrosine phosphatase [Thermomicrobiales bacterium]